MMAVTRLPIPRGTAVSLQLARVVALLVLLAARGAAQPAAWEIRGSGGGGALYAPSFSPHRQGELFLNCDMSNVFHSTNFGKQWRTVDFRQLGSVVAAPVSFTADPAVLFAVHHGGNWRRPARSSDGGIRWSALASDPTGGLAQALLADPGSTQRLLLADANAVYFSANGGVSFTNAVSAASASGCRMAGAFFSGDSCFLATSTGFFVCPDLTAAAPLWNAVSAGGIPASERIWAFAASRQGAALRFCCLTFDSASVKAGNLPQRTYQGFRNMYTLDWGQATWTNRSASLPAGAVPAFVDMCENNVNELWLCGEGADQFGRRVFSAWRSANGGATWTSVLATANNGNIFTAWGGQNGDNGWGWWGCPNGFDVDPKNPDLAAFCDMGWLHLTTDGGATWRQAYSDSTVYHQSGSNTPKYRSYASAGLEVTCAYWITWIDSLSMIASYADILAQRSSDRGSTWSFNYTGLSAPMLNDVGIILKHPVSNILYAATGEVVGANGQFTDARAGSPGRVCLSADGGLTWQVMHNFGHTVQSIALDPARPARMYACVTDVPGGAGGVYMCDNIALGSASVWSRLAAPPRTEGRAKELHVLRDGALVAVYGARDAGNWQFTQSSGVFLSTDGGATWTDRSAAGLRSRLNSLLVDPADTTGNTWYAFVGLAGPTGQPGVHRSTDRGANWIRLSTQGAWSGTFNPRRSDEMYLCTDGMGLIYLRDARGSAPSTSSDSLFPFRNPMRVFFHPYDDREMWVASFGNGLYVGRSDLVPVELSRFAAMIDGTHARLEWESASETNAFGFEVQSRAADPEDWRSIGFVASRGGGPHRYVFLDPHPLDAGTRQYRLRMLDCDGSASTSPVVILSRERAPARIELAVAPNPARDAVIVTLRLRDAARVRLRVFDIAGCAVGNESLYDLRAGTHALPVDASGLPPGRYFLTAEGDGSTALERITVVR